MDVQCTIIGRLLKWMVCRLLRATHSLLQWSNRARLNALLISFSCQIYRQHCWSNDCQVHAKNLQDPQHHELQSCSCEYQYAAMYSFPFNCQPHHHSLSHVILTRLDSGYYLWCYLPSFPAWSTRLLGTTHWFYLRSWCYVRSYTRSCFSTVHLCSTCSHLSSYFFDPFEISDPRFHQWSIIWIS